MMTAIIILLTLSTSSLILGNILNSPPSVYNCFKNQGFNYIMVLAYFQEKISPYAQPQINNALNAGIQSIDVVLFANSSGDPQYQSQEISKLSGYRMVWCQLYCGNNNASSIVSYLEALKKSLKGIAFGIRTEKDYWNKCTDGWNGWSDVPLWYLGTNTEMNLDDFISFGGWSKPAIKHFPDMYRICQTGVFESFY